MTNIINSVYFCFHREDILLLVFFFLIHGDLTSLMPEESLPELPVVPLRKPHSGKRRGWLPAAAPHLNLQGRSSEPRGGELGRGPSPYFC